MNKTEKLQKVQQLLNRLDDLQAKDPVRSVERLLEEEQTKTRDANPSGTALKVLARGLANVQSDPRPQKMFDDLEAAKTDTKSQMDGLSTTFASEIQSLKDEIQSAQASGKELTEAQITDILGRLAEHEGTFSTGMKELISRDTELEGEVSRILTELTTIYGRLDAIPDLAPNVQTNTESVSRVTQSTDNLSKDLAALRKELTARINQIGQRGGGNMNRSILVGGDKDTLSKFTDINLKAGAGTTITYAANQTTQYTDITITATGSGSGITRSIQTVATNTLAANSPSIDYVYLASGNITITLPTTVANTNLYTIKNIGAGTVTINTTGGELIDGSATCILPLQFTSVDLISNNSGNWDIT